VTRLRSEDGMTLPEVLIAATVGFIVLAATLGLLESTLRLSGGVMSKTDAMQRGRLAMDRVTQQLRSQVCLDLSTPAIVKDSTADSVTFYSDFGSNPATPPSKRTLTFDPATGDITETVWAGAGPAGGPYTYNGTPRRNLILENAARQQRKLPDGTQVDVPFLSFYAFEETGTPPRLDATATLAPPLDDAESARVARIDVAFSARPTGAKNDQHAVHVEDRVAVRHADPNLTVPDPMCV
jgi:hypothetical protein